MKELISSLAKSLYLLTDYKGIDVLESNRMGFDVQVWKIYFFSNCKDSLVYPHKVQG